MSLAGCLPEGLKVSESATRSARRSAEEAAVRLGGLPGSLPEDGSRAGGAAETCLATQTSERCL